jgi:hypothetical protein
MIVKCNKLASLVCWCCACNSDKNFILCISQNAVGGAEIFGGMLCNTGNCRSVRKWFTSWILFNLFNTICFNDGCNVQKEKNIYVYVEANKKILYFSLRGLSITNPQHTTKKCKVFWLWYSYCDVTVSIPTCCSPQEIIIMEPISYNITKNKMISCVHN